MEKLFFSKKHENPPFSTSTMVYNSPFHDLFMPFQDKLMEAITQYNRYRVNLVQAELREHDETGFVVFFDGSFCETCGYYDYYDDLQVLLEDEYGILSKITEINHIEKGDNVRFGLLLDDAQSNS